MTVKELIESLKKCPEDYEVWCNYCGDNFDEPEVNDKEEHVVI